MATKSDSGGAQLFKTFLPIAGLFTFSPKLGFARGSCYEEYRSREEIIAGIHTALDLAGLVPGVGEVADVINAVLYSIEGEGADALISLAGAIPVIGDFATGARLSRRAAIAAAGLTAETVKGYQAHHVFSRASSTTWDLLGIKWDDVSNAVWWEAKDHLSQAWNYQQEGNRWISGNQGIINSNKALAADEARSYAE
ncbi:MAG: hypothetical protein JNM66_11720 [Bryobacterales bacterium]|nr:hypothetical protein [Bryobacterales bacterium]